MMTLSEAREVLKEDSHLAKLATKLCRTADGILLIDLGDEDYFAARELEALLVVMKAQEGESCST